MDLILFARDGTTVYKIHTGTGQVAATRTLRMDSPESMTMIAGPHEVLLVPIGPRPGWVYEVPDGQPGAKTTGPFADVDNVTAGPPGALWITRISKSGPVTILTDFQGRPTQRDGTPAQYQGYDGVTTDGAGGLMVASPGGWYQLTTAGPRRITTGHVLATGPHHYLTSNCDAQMRCSRYLQTRTGQQRRIGPAPRDDYGNGKISADGRYAALWMTTATYDDQGTPIGSDTLNIVDLATGRTISRFENQIGNPDDPSLIWLPDNRLIGIRDGRIFLFDPTSRRFTTPDLQLSDQLTQLALRPQ